MIALLMCILILIVTIFLKNAHPLHLPPFDVDNFKMNANQYDAEDLQLKEVMKSSDDINYKRRVRRSYGQKSKCAIERKTFCKVLTINKITKNICLTFHMRRCVGLD